MPPFATAMKTLPLMILTNCLLLNFPATRAIEPFNEISCVIDVVRRRQPCYLEAQKYLNQGPDSNKCCILARYHYCLFQESVSCTMESLIKSLGSIFHGCEKASLLSIDCLYYFHPIGVTFALFFLATLIGLCLFKYFRSHQIKIHVSFIPWYRTHQTNTQANSVLMMRENAYNRGFHPTRGSGPLYQGKTASATVSAPSAPTPMSGMPGVGAQSGLTHNDLPPSYSEMQQKYKGFRG